MLNRHVAANPVAVLARWNVVVEDAFLALATSAVHGNSDLEMVGALFGAEDAEFCLCCIPVPEDYVDQSYGQLFTTLCYSNVVPLALYRHDVTGEDQFYIATNPPPDTLLRPEDMVYVMVHNQHEQQHQEEPPAAPLYAHGYVGQHWGTVVGEDGEEASVIVKEALRHPEDTPSGSQEQEPTLAAKREEINPTMLVLNDRRWFGHTLDLQKRKPHKGHAERLREEHMKRQGARGEQTTVPC
eukprot:TRINITY_DN33620_c0_g1_i1.p1 TRINITY_DN33620_c0_g1~~TRINITY_DN33620_c0_g1_i1.p1  ORF type:complete len:241 (-),score=73.36 TRINITY_DN33620_c0_g1_i1:152-874(-)